MSVAPFTVRDPHLGSWGPLIVSTDIDDALIGVLRVWLPGALRQISDERSLATVLPTPRDGDYVSVLDNDEFVDQNLPTIAVTTAKTTGVPARQPDGSYSAMWRTVISAVVRGRTKLETRKTAAYYEGSIRRVMEQQAARTALIHSVRWQAAGVDPVVDVSRQGRYLAAGISAYNVAVDRAVQDMGGPKVPNAEPYIAEATVTKATFQVEPKPQEASE